MKKLAFFTIVLTGFFILLSATPQKKKFYKGNLHAHSYWSDGNTFPEAVASWFKNNGYQFLAVTDHNLLQEGDKWYHVDRNEAIRKNYENYMQHFGQKGIETESRDNGLYVKLKTLDEYRNAFEVPGEFLLIDGEEVSDAAMKKPVHLNAINTSTQIDPTKGETVAECLKMNVDRMKESLEKDGNTEWVIVNHPNFGWALTAADMAASGALFFEVFNGHPSVKNYGDEERPGTEEQWDEVNFLRTNKGEPLLMGVATDDSHDYLNYGLGKANPGRGWVMVRSSDLSPKSLYEAMLKGDFYSSTGVELVDFKTGKRSMTLQVLPEAGVDYTVEFIACMKGDQNATVVSRVEGTKANYRFTGKESFVRARVISTKLHPNPFSEGDVEMAWLQPVQLR